MAAFTSVGHATDPQTLTAATAAAHQARADLRGAPTFALVFAGPKHDLRVALSTGAVLQISARHPTADGRLFGDLRAGDLLDGLAIESAAVVPYAHDATYDILPASETGAYYAAGALVGSTLAP